VADPGEAKQQATDDRQEDSSSVVNGDGFLVARLWQQ